MTTRKIVISTNFGGFGLSEWAQTQLSMTDNWRIARDDPRLVAIVEAEPLRAATEYADLKVVEIPADVDWVIENDSYREWVAEAHRRWG